MSLFFAPSKPPTLEALAAAGMERATSACRRRPRDDILMLRVGYGPPAPFSLLRPLDAVITEGGG